MVVLKALSVFFAACTALVGQASWQPSAGHAQIPIWPENVVGGAASENDVNTTTSKDNVVAGKPVFRIDNVVRPTITFYAPRTRNSHVAVIVFPGGGYSHLAMDIEGTEVCDRLNSMGLTCVLFKYRVPNSGPYPRSSAALEDAQRAMSLVRSHAAEHQIDPHRIGVMGFSAGAHLAAAMSTHNEKRMYSPIDASDQISSRPDFAAIIYPGYLASVDRDTPGSNCFPPNPDLPVTKDTPPGFLVQTEDDRVAHVESSIAYYLALKNAGVPAEMHLYAEGVHGYGLRPTGLPVANWPQLFETWLHTIKVLSLIHI